MFEERTNSPKGAKYFHISVCSEKNILSMLLFQKESNVFFNESLKQSFFQWIIITKKNPNKDVFINGYFFMFLLLLHSYQQVS